MIQKFFIEQADVEKIAGGYSAESLWDEDDYEEWKESLQQNLLDYIKSVPGGEKLKADEICNMFYPEAKVSVFISHSSKDKAVAQKLALWLRDNLDLYSFIDSDLWGNIEEVQKILDDEYCDPSPNYNYKKRNLCTAHVHMILAYALTRMIDRVDFFIFVKSDGSVFIENALERTTSSWIFHELVTASLIKTRSSFDVFGESRTVNLCEAQESAALQISYPIPLDDFEKLDKGKLQSVARNYSSLKQNDGDSFSRLFELKKYWSTILKKEGIPSNEVVAKNCLLGYQKKSDSLWRV